MSNVLFYKTNVAIGRQAETENLAKKKNLSFLLYVCKICSAEDY